MEQSTDSDTNTRPDSRPVRRLGDPGVNAKRPLSWSDFQVCNRSLPGGSLGMDLDWKAACGRRGKAQRRDNVRHHVLLDVIAMQMDLQRFVGDQTNHHLVVLASRQLRRLGGRRVAMNGKFENTLVRMGDSDRHGEQCGGQQRASGI
jgi:hypothetical protein